MTMMASSRRLLSSLLLSALVLIIGTAPQVQARTPLASGSASLFDLPRRGWRLSNRVTKEKTMSSTEEEAEKQVELSSLLKGNDEQEQEQEDATDSTMHLLSKSTGSTASSESEEEEQEEMTGLLLTTRGGAAAAVGTGTGTVYRGRGKAEKETASTSAGVSMTASVFNLVNNVAGAGILALSAGMTGGTGWIPSVLLVIGLGIISSHSFKIIGEACEITQEQDFKGLWSRTVSPQSTYMVDSMICIMCFAAAIIYSGILGDVFTPLLEQAGIPAQYNTRTSNIIAITASLLLPLSLIKNLSALAFTSILGFCAIAYTVFFIVYRALDGSYALETGRFVAQAETAALLEAIPAFEKSSFWGFGFTSLVLISNLGLAFIAHYNAPVFYRQLQDTNPNRFAKMVDISFTILVALYVITMTAGYSTFGDVCRGNLLLNYHPHDILSTCGRLATGFSILFGFPLVLCGARESLTGVLSSLGFQSIGKDEYHFALVTAMLIFVTAISCSVDDVSLVVGLTGAAMGASIVYICPPILYTKAVKLIKGQDSVEYSKAKPSLLLVPFGIFCGALGVYMTIKEAMNK